MGKNKQSRIFEKSSEKGQDLAEYALIVGLIAIVVVLAVTLIGHELRDVFYNIAAGFLF